MDFASNLLQQRVPKPEGFSEGAGPPGHGHGHPALTVRPGRRRRHPCPLGCELAASLAERFPGTDELLHQTREDVLAFRHFPAPHWRKIWSTNLLERVNQEIKRRTRVVGIFHNDAANGLWPTSSTPAWWERCCWSGTSTGMEGRRLFSPESMAAIPALDDLPA
jgi:hypothetical protein